MNLTPLQRSAEYDAVESELKALFLYLSETFLGDKVRELGLSGMPNLGSDEFISRQLNNDGLSILRDTSDENIRYLFHAWRYRNPQRGTAFLRAYLNTLFGQVFTIDQMWCPKNGVYPDDVRDSYEMATSGANYDDYFLTSRLRVDIETSALPDKVIAAARTALAARMVLEMRIAKRIHFETPIAFVAHGLTVSRMISTTRYTQREVVAQESAAMPMTSGRVTLVRSRSAVPTYVQRNVFVQATVTQPMSSGGVTLVRTRGDGG